jgi:hypothetical protein
MGHPGHDAACDLHRAPLVVSREHDRELVASEPEGLAAAAELPRDGDEDLVSRLVSQLVVHALEIVDVDHAQREPAALALRPVEIGLEPLVEVAAVAEARQRVGERQPRRL